MNFLELVKARYSSRNYEDRPHSVYFITAE